MSRSSVVLVHSIGLNSQAYSALCDRMPNGVELIVYDQRGHGARAAESSFTLADLVADAQAQVAQCSGPVHLVGHSLGGCVAALAAAGARGRVRSLVLMATPASGLPVFLDRSDAFLEDHHAAAEATLLRWFGAGVERHPVAMATARRALEQASPAGVACAWRALASFGGYGTIAPPLPPTLCVAGGHDMSTPPQLMQGIVSARQSVQADAAIQLVTVPDAGHMLPLTHAQEVATLLLHHWQMDRPPH